MVRANNIVVSSFVQYVVMNHMLLNWMAFLYEDSHGKDREDTQFG